jgi:hypothetical protein
MAGRVYFLPRDDGRVAARAGQVLRDIVGAFVTKLATTHRIHVLLSLVAGSTGVLGGVAIDTYHHGTGSATRCQIKAMPHTTVAITAVKLARLAVHDLVLQQPVWHQKLIARDLLRQVPVTDNALLGLGLADVRDQASMTSLLVLGLALSSMARYATQGSMWSLHRLGLDPIDLGGGRILGTGLQG